MRTIKKTEASGEKRVNVNIEISLHNAFKAATAAKGTDMTTVLQEYIESYVAKNAATTSRKGRRA